MELRRTEEEVRSIAVTYESLRRRTTPMTTTALSSLPSIAHLCRRTTRVVERDGVDSVGSETAAETTTTATTTTTTRPYADDNGDNNADKNNTDGDDDECYEYFGLDYATKEKEKDGSKEKNEEGAAAWDAKSALAELESLRDRVAGVTGRAERFRRRLTEKDPITDAPRYGERTVTRVTRMVDLTEIMQMAIRSAFGEVDAASETAAEKEENDSAAAATTSSSSSSSPTSHPMSFVEEMRRIAEKEEEESIRSREEAAAAEANDELERAERKRREEDRMKEEAKAVLESKRREEERLRRRAEMARREREEREEEAARAARDADRAFVDSIGKGPDGVREQLETLRRGTESDVEARSTAIRALHTIFSQIVAHPEEMKYRRIRRDHPKFIEDIGRHPGGKEVLIAAGFKLETLDGVSCFFSKEPDIEHDMDGWSEWFNSLKNTLEIIEEMIK